MSKTVEEAWQEWLTRPTDYSMNLSLASFVAGAAHGAAGEREAVLAIVDEFLHPVRTEPGDRWTVACELIAARIRQRGEK